MPDSSSLSILSTFKSLRYEFSLPGYLCLMFGAMLSIASVLGYVAVGTPMKVLCIGVGLISFSLGDHRWHYGLITIAWPLDDLSSDERREVIRAERRARLRTAYRKVTAIPFFLAGASLIYCALWR